MRIPVVDDAENGLRDSVLDFVKRHDLYFFPLIPTLIGIVVCVMVLNANIQLGEAKATIGQKMAAFALESGCPCENMLKSANPLDVFNQSGKDSLPGVFK